MGLCGDFTFFGHVIRQMQLLLLTMEILLERNDRSLVLCGIQELTICVCTRTKSQRRSNYRFRQNFTFLKRKRNRYPRWRRNLLYVFDWVWKLSIVKFPQSPILLLNKSVFPIAMYCFCRFFVSKNWMHNVAWAVRIFYPFTLALTLGMDKWLQEIWSKGISMFIILTCYKYNVDAHNTFAAHDIIRYTTSRDANYREVEVY